MVIYLRRKWRVILLLDYLNATDVRKNWSQFNDDVVRVGPQFVKRNRDK